MSMSMRIKVIGRNRYIKGILTLLVMKRFSFISFLCMLLTSCQFTELIETMSTDEIYASIDTGIASKTSLDEDNNIRWSEGDQIVAFMQSSLGIKYQIMPDYIGKTSGKFSKVSSESSDNLYAGIELDHNVIYYPYTDNINIEKFGDDYELDIVLPSEQIYTEGSFGYGAMPMVAVSTDKNITFKNICGGMKLQLKGSQKIISIKVEGKNNELLSGPATLIAHTDNTKPTITMSSGAYTSVGLDCGLGVQLNESTSTEFIIVLPPVHFNNGLVVTLKDEQNNEYKIETDKSNKVLRSSILVMPTVVLGESGVEFPEDGNHDMPPTVEGHNPEPYFSETVELMGVIWRLAGAPEYNDCNVTSVVNSLNTHFASVKNHHAVTLAQSYRQRGISYDAVAAYGNQLIFSENGDLIFDPDYMEGSNTSFDRWNYQQKNDMLNAVNDFYNASDFNEWFTSTEQEQKQAIASFKTVCNIDYTWFDSFYGKNDNLSSRIILSFMNGGNNYGNSLKRKDGTFLLSPVLGCLNQFSGNVTFNGDMNLIVHEFNHPYCNPLIEANWSSISAKANEVYSEVRTIMESQAYGNPRTMMCETLVRSCAIRYMLTHDMEDSVNWYYEYEESCGFLMVRYLVKALAKRDENAPQYATLADFMPELIDAINKFKLTGTAEPDTQPHDYVDLGIDIGDGKKLYFATRNVGEDSPAGIGSNVYRWGTTIEWGKAWKPDDSDSSWPAGHRLDAAHDIATIKWGGDWHTPSPEEWDLLVEKCDYERKEANESGYGVAGYFFYNKSARNKFIFLPVSTYDNELMYWSSEILSSSGTYSDAIYFASRSNTVGCLGRAGTGSTAFAVRPVIAAAGDFNANGHDYVDLGIEMSDGTKIYFATMNVGETHPGGYGSEIYRWGATERSGKQWIKYAGWPAGTKLDAAHDIATITWGEKWHTPSREEWNLLAEKCNYERKEANESGYGVAGYFFYNKSDRNKFIFLPVSTLSNELGYWSTEISEPEDYICVAYVFESFGQKVSCKKTADIESTGFAIRPVFVE